MGLGLEEEMVGNMCHFSMRRQGRAWGLVLGAWGV